MRKFQRILQRLDVSLIQFFVYIGGLFYLLIKGYAWWLLVIFHITFVLVYGIIYFRHNFLIFFLAPLTAILIPIENIILKRYLRNFKQNYPAEVVIILGQSNYFKLDAWIKLNFLKSEIEWLVRYLNTRVQEFSFYPQAELKDVKKIMKNRNVKEVYFFGHGNSHTFQLNTDKILYYCDFDDAKYSKEFVHQVHCGTPDGKSLIDYVVTKKNRPKCFLFRKTINSSDIIKEFKRRIKDLEANRQAGL